MGNRRRSLIRSLHRTRFESVLVQGGDVGMVEGPFSQQTARWTPLQITQTAARLMREMIEGAPCGSPRQRSKLK